MSKKRKLKAVAGARGAAPADLPASREVWEADIVTFDDLEMDGEPMPFDVRVTLVVEDGTGVIVGSQVQPAADDVEALASSVLEAMTAPMVGDPRRPSAVRIRRSRLAAALAERLPKGVDVELADTLPCVAAASAELAETFLTPDDEDLAAPLPEAAMKDFFDAAAAFYEAAPWTAIGRDVVLEVTVGALSASYGVVLSEELAGMTGLALHETLDSLRALHADEPAAAGMSVVFFMPESAVPPPVVEERKRHRWRVAGPAAFPALTRLDAEGTELEPDEPELRRFSAALRAVATLANGLEGDGAAAVPAAARTVVVTSLGGDTTEVRIAAAPAAELWQTPGGGSVPRLAAGGSGFASDGAPDDDELSADMPLADVVRVVELIHRLPAMQPTMTRLAWTFFRAPGPLHVAESNTQARDDSLGRFTEWVFFSARPANGARTLAEQAIDVAGDELADAGAAALLAACTPRHSVYRVVDATDDALVVDDLLRHERLVVTTDGTDGALEVGEQFLGNLFPHTPGQWALGSTVSTVEGTLLPEAEAPDQEVAAVEAEELVFGATSDWLDEIVTIAGLRDTWQEFREDIGGGGTELPTFGELQQRVREAELPDPLIGALVGSVDWWSIFEAELCAHFIERVWQLTPRDELAGRSPQAVHDAARRRRKRARSKRRKR